MIKKISAIALSVLMCCQAPVYANYLKKAEFTSDLKVAIEGKAENAPGEKVSILIIPSESDVSDLAGASNPSEFFEIADYYREITAESDGSFKLEVLFDDKDKGYRDIKIAVAGDVEEYKKAVYVVKENDIISFVSLVNGKKSSDDVFVTYILDNLPIIAEEASVYTSDTSLRPAVAAELLKVRDFMYDKEFKSTSDIKAAFNMAQLVSLLNKAESESDIDELISDYKIQSHLSKECFMAYYDDSKSDALSELKKKTPLDTESFYNILGETLILSKIKNVSNHNEVTDILNDSNDFLGFDLDKYNALSDKSSVNKEVMKKTGSMSEFKSEFETLVKKASENIGKKPSGSSSPSGGGGGSVGSVSFNQDIITPDTPKEYFNDLHGFDWAKNSINSLAALGIVNGVGQGRFEPSRYVTREEFVKMIVEAFSSLDVNVENPFEDITADDWCSAYVATAFKNGFVNGKSHNVFGKGDSISRQDAALILARITGKASSVKAQFADIGDVSAYAQDAVNLMAELKVINGNENGEFLPLNSLTRAECAKVIYSLYSLIAEVK